jgi:preprotein translocase subunit SecE
MLEGPCSAGGTTIKNAFLMSGYRTSDGIELRSEAIMAKVTPGEFVRQVRQETAKVTWPTRKETAITTGMVFVMVFLAAMFFLLVDLVLRNGVRVLLDFGGMM